MPRRYEIVGEPEALEVVDDEAPIYQPDQSGLSIHHLRPISSGEPIKLSTIFMDPRWTPGQRKVCFITLATVTGCLLLVLLALLVGLVNVLKAIAYVEREQAAGLQISPGFVPDENDKVMMYFRTRSGEEGTNQNFQGDLLNSNMDNYLQIYRVLQVYQNKSKEAKCDGDPNCAFDFDELMNGNKLNCTNDTHFGWNGQAEPPCILLKFVKPEEWSLEDNFPADQSHINVTCKMEGSGAVMRKTLPVDRFSNSGAFPVKYLKGAMAEAGVPPMTWLRLTEDDVRGYDQLPVTIVCALQPKASFVTKEFVGLPLQRFKLYVTKR